MSQKAQPPDATGCRWPSKRQYPTAREAKDAIASMRQSGRFVDDMQPYHCPAGHWHVGHSIERFRRRIRHSLRKRSD